MTIVLVLIEIVGAHDAPSATFLDGGLESRQVDLVEGTVADDDVHLMAVFLVVVQGVVLHAGSHTFRLQTLHVGHHHLGCQIGVFAHILEVAASKWGTVDVHARSQHYTLVTIQGFFAKTLAVDAGHLWIPCSSQTGEGREGHARVVGLSGLFPLVPKHVRTHTVRTVVRPQVREAKTLHTRA